MLLLASMLAFPGISIAQDTTPPSIAETKKLVAKLAGSDLEDRLEVLQRLRLNQKTTREALLSSLKEESPDKERWWLVHHLSEFGTPRDIPFLLRLLPKAKDQTELLMITRVAQGLYQPVAHTRENPVILEDFSFIQSRPPKLLSGKNKEKWRLSQWSFVLFHRRKLPLNLIKKLESHLNKPVASKELLIEKLKKRVGGNDWDLYGEIIQEGVDQIVEKSRIEGKIKIRLSNTLKAPLLLSVKIDAWYGKIESMRTPIWIYLPPQSKGNVTASTALVAPANERGIRLDLRLKEVGGTELPSFNKLYLQTIP